MIDAWMLLPSTSDLDVNQSVWRTLTIFLHELRVQLATALHTFWHLHH